jgi:DNA-binding response OmpR family regulator
MVNERVFLIDDDSDFLEVCAKRLEAHHYQVDRFLNASDALKAVRLKKPDLIISDIKMEGLNGLEVCDLLRSNRHTKGTPIILMTGYQGKREYVESLNVPFLFFMSKPFKSEELLATVRTALDSVPDEEGTAAAR